LRQQRGARRADIGVGRGSDDGKDAIGDAQVFARDEQTPAQGQNLEIGVTTPARS
jgi:hypothetical protein